MGLSDSRLRVAITYHDADVATTEYAGPPSFSVVQPRSHGTSEEKNLYARQSYLRNREYYATYGEQVARPARRERRKMSQEDRRLYDARVQFRKSGRVKPAICDVGGTEPKTSRDMHRDHCHTTLVFRGWLCRECNLAIGTVNDDPKRLRLLADYLEVNRGSGWNGA